MLRVLDAFLGFAGREFIFVVGVGALLAGLISGSLFGDLGVSELFHPVIPTTALALCGGRDAVWPCLGLLHYNPLGNPSFQAGALATIFNGIVFVFWLDRAGAVQCNAHIGSAKPMGALQKLVALSFSMLLPLALLIFWSASASGEPTEVGRIRAEVLQFAAGLVFGLAASAFWLAIVSPRVRNASPTNWIAIVLALSIITFFSQTTTTVDALLLMLSLPTALYILVRHIGWASLSRLRPSARAAVLVTAISLYVGLVYVHERLPINTDAVRPYRIAEIDHAVEGGPVRLGHNTSCLTLAAAFSSSSSAIAPSLRRGKRETAQLIAPTDVLDRAFPGNSPAKIVVVAASGGAYRATFWTAAVLDALLAESNHTGHFAGLADSIVLLTGASGGAVALAYYAAGYKQEWIGKVDPLSSFISEDIQAAAPPPDGDPDRIDSLRPIANHLMSHDLRDMFLQRRCGEDRGRKLEGQWPTLAKTTFADLIRRQKVGHAPQIIFQPTIVQTGEPLYITNLDMPVAGTQRLSLIEFLPGAQKHMTLASAARLSATFPIVTPAVDVPLPAIRTSRSGADEKSYRIAMGRELSSMEVSGLVDGQVVDAGYFDNQGVDAAASFLLRDEVIDWIKARPMAKVYVLEIRAQIASPVGTEVSSFDMLHLFGSPFSAYLSSTDRGTVIRSDRTWDLVAARLGTNPEGAERLLRFTFNNYRMQSVPMTWFISAAARHTLKDEMRATHNSDELDRLKRAWNR